jgi:hypothetical protein
VAQYWTQECAKEQRKLFEQHERSVVRERVKLRRVEDLQKDVPALNTRRR